MAKAKRYMVIGLGRFGSAVIEALEKHGCDVVAVDRDMAAVERVKETVTLAVQADATDPEALRSLDAATCEVALVAIGEDFESAALAVASLKELGVPRIIARAQTARRGRILASAGAHELVEVESEMGARLGKRLAEG